MSHHLKHHKWINGTLNTFTKIFESLSDAKEFAKKVDGDSIKIYNDDGECVHEHVNQPQDTYA